jgi:hypothetical protein
MRRLTTLLAILFVLFGTAVPALACTAGMSKGDCCPEGSTAPCGDEGAGFNADAPVTACCVSPLPSSSASINATRNPAEQSSHSGGPDPIVATAWLATFHSLPNVARLQTRVTAPLTPDGAQTYLRTGRLRL